MKTIICKGCGKEIESSYFRTHARLCESYKQWKQSLIDKMTYEFIYHEYVIEEKSTYQIANELGFSKPTEVSNKLKEYGIRERTFKEGRKAKGYIALCQKTSMERYGAPYHTMKESSIREKIDDGVKQKYGCDNVFQAEEIKEKIKQTSLEHFGYEHPSQSEVVKEKVRNTCIERFGVDNVFKSEEIREKIRQTNLAIYGCEYAVQNEEIKQTNKERYGYEYVMQNEEIKEKARITKKENNVFGHSKNAEEFFEYLTTKFNLSNVMFLPRTKEIYLKKEKSCFHYDFAYRNKIIEFNGNFWHANPKIYPADWINKVTNMTAKEIWDRDKQKQELAEKNGYDFLTIWEDDVKENRDREIEKCRLFLEID